jgi:CO dehydrogenase/acetyl-CoA synthase beta subunit
LRASTGTAIIASLTGGLITVRTWEQREEEEEEEEEEKEEEEEEETYTSPRDPYLSSKACQCTVNTLQCTLYGALFL